MANIERPAKRARATSFDSDFTERVDESIIEKYIFRAAEKMKFPDRYDDKIYVTGGTEIHFTTDVSDDSIERLKKIISDVLHEHNKDLVERHSYEENDGSRSPVGDDSDVKKFVITYIVNSPGGSVSSVMGFVDYLAMVKKKYSNVEFASVATGLVASAGTIMCVAADKRKMTRNAFAMIHELSASPGYTNYTRLQTHAEFCKKLHVAGVNIYLEQIGKDPSNEEHVKDLESKLLRETWLSAEEYKELGFVDEIM